MIETLLHFVLKRTEIYTLEIRDMKIQGRSK